MTKPRQKTCRNRDCRTKFTPWNSMQIACSPKCALVIAAQAAEKRQERDRLEQARVDRKVKESLKTRRDWLKEAQQAFNAWIRERDADLPCVSCGELPSGAGARGGVWDCGHYRSTGANPELRFEPLNAHKQCKKCNQHLSGNVVNYRIELERRIGAEKLAWLEGPHEPTKWTAEELKAIRDKYRALVREMRKAA